MPADDDGGGIWKGTAVRFFFVLSENFHSQIAGDHDGVRRGDLFAAARGT